MNLGLADAHVVLAGSSRGLGNAIAGAFRDEGAQVWLSGRDPISLESASKRLGNSPFTSCDLQTASGRTVLRQSVEAKWDTVDVLVLNVGSGASSHRGLDTPDEEWLRVFQLNFLTHAALLRDFLPLLRTGRLKAVVGISSIAGETRLPAPLAYGAAKAALIHLCSSAAAALASDGIRYNLVSPGNVLTPGGRWEEKLAADSNEVNRYLEQNVPLNRFARPEEIAAAVTFLSSTRSGFCTGTQIRVDGGQVPRV